jgi:hypothetical protein
MRKRGIIGKIFGKKFGLSDVFLVSGLLPAIYFTFMGINFESGLMAVYLDFIATPLSYATIGKLLIQNILNKASK